MSVAEDALMEVIPAVDFKEGECFCSFPFSTFSFSLCQGPNQGLYTCGTCTLSVKHTVA